MIRCAEGGGGGGGAATLWAGALSVVAALPPSLSGVSVPCDSGRPYYADPVAHVAAPTHVQHQVYTLPSLSISNVFLAILSMLSYISDKKV